MNLATKIEALHSKIQTLRSLASPEAVRFVEQRLYQENEELETKISDLKQKIANQELRFGILQYQVPKKTIAHSGVKTAAMPAATQSSELPEPVKNNHPASPARTVTQARGASDAAQSKPTAASKTPPKSTGRSGGGSVEAANTEIDVGRLDMRVGRIMEVSPHPDADSLYVEKVDLGEGRLRTVVSGLVKFVPIEALQNRVGIFLCNLKPAKMRGVESEAMLMCASAPEAGGVEPLVLDSEAAVSLGDSVIVPGYAHNPDAQLNPKKKIFEQVKPDLRVDQDGFATYKGARWTLKAASGVSIKANKLRDVQIA